MSPCTAHCDKPSAVPQGCRKELEKWVNEHMFIIMVVMFALIAVEVSGERGVIMTNPKPCSRRQVVTVGRQQL